MRCRCSLMRCSPSKITKTCWTKLVSQNQLTKRAVKHNQPVFIIDDSNIVEVPTISNRRKRAKEGNKEDQQTRKTIEKVAKNGKHRTVQSLQIYSIILYNFIKRA